MLIRTVGIGKRYYRGLRPTLGSLLVSGAKSILQSPASISKSGSWVRSEDMAFWAVKDVSVELKRGESLGILGYNGSGKSTLMRMMCGVTRPTAGYAEVYGRTVFLGGTGLGMHPELTGRENVFVNGTIMGEKRSEIARKFDEIVGFAGLERFIDTPMKFYSTGMVSRLAFSVAAHITTEVLILDEVLMAGDWKFQMKCVDRIRSIAESDGRTVVVCSHAISHVRRVAKRCILLENGRLILDGPTDDVMDYYESGTGPLVELAAKRREEYGLTPPTSSSVIGGDFPETAKKNPEPQSKHREPDAKQPEPIRQQPAPVPEKQRTEVERPSDNGKPMVLRRIAIAGGGGELHNEFHGWEAIRIRIDYDVNRMVRGGRVQLGVMASNETVVLSASDFETDNDLLHLRLAGAWHCEVEIPPRWLSPGLYRVEVVISNQNEPGLSERQGGVSFRILDSDLLSTFYEETGGRPVLKPLLHWTTTQSDAWAGTNK
ncbi:MAG TPA: ATP-binding cassette domain-containing protein [bacterium]|nr:ATP-binding cassette domain-containing protein [bacterium]